MKMHKLFGVLVVGGSMLVGAACAGDPDRDDDKDKVVNGPDAAQEQPAADAAAHTDATAGELTPCFCDTQACCDDGVVEDGFECCWSTTC